MNRGRGAFALTALACAWLISLVPAAALLPLGSEQTSYSNGLTTTSSTTLVQSDGSWVLGLMAVPALLALIAWFGLHRRCKGRAGRRELVVWIPIGLLYAFSFVGGFSVGLSVLPAALALGFAGAITPRGRAAR
jgi:membrane protease YdiL (CAAX protease family)